MTTTHTTQMPSTYELMEAYRTWWRASYGTTPNSQAVIVAAAWAQHAIETFAAGSISQTAKPTK